MNLIVIHRNKNSETGNGKNLLRFAISSEPITDILLDGLNRSSNWSHNKAGILRSLVKRHPFNVVCAVPEKWSIKPNSLPGTTSPKIIPYAENIPISPELRKEINRKGIPNSWFVISNGRFATQVNSELIEKVLAGFEADIVTVNVEPELLGKREKFRLTAQGEVAGFRRLYSDSAEFAPVPADWPHHIIVKTNVLDRILTDYALPLSFHDFMEKCRSKELTLCTLNLGGTVLDLETKNGLLNFCRMIVGSLPPEQSYAKTKNCFKSTVTNNNDKASREPRILGKVIFGKNVSIGPEAVVVGPTIIGHDVKIERGAVINSSIIGPQIRIPKSQLVQNCVVKGPQCNWKSLTRTNNNYSMQNTVVLSGLFVKQGHHAADTFRNWPKFSYAKCFKRTADCFASLTVLILFAPIIPFIALAIKLSSPGPIFFKDKRQGLHGKTFGCLKFRTMVVGADKIQDKLRIVSQVDGPQFKMDDDPRINAVGRFLRETHIDEIPQFLNVLLGQMSVVGPRPSPESENTLNPLWRDARLSVRPGITGLWQICRTRQPMKDFQEWIHYDTKYVKNISLKMDLWICWQTAMKLAGNFISQF